jgi:hypothetical protein
VRRNLALQPGEVAGLGGGGGDDHVAVMALRG